MTAAHNVADAPEGEAEAQELRAAERLARGWLATGQPEGAFDREPVHLPLVFPEVWEERGGFDAVVGNPPFLGGQKLTGAMGEPYREYLVGELGRGARGSADLVAYFLLRTHELLNGDGQAGLIATNTLAQGDTREVGLDQLVADGVEIRQAVKSRPWPSRSAVLEYCAVWTSCAALAEGAVRLADGRIAKVITPTLEGGARITGEPSRLVENQGLAFQGSIVLGLGFTLDAEVAEAWIAKDERYRQVLFPYLNGQDLNSRPDGSARRWVINFHDWKEEQAQTYQEAYEKILLEVKPERLRVKFSKNARERWWQYERRRPELYDALAMLDRMIVLTRHSKSVMPLFVNTGQVASEATVVFASADAAVLAVLSSAPHYWWALKHAGTMKGDLRYGPSDVFETFARPELTPALRELGDQLDTRRREIMLKRGGLTATYNLVHDETCTDPDIAELREIHRAIDEEVARAYGWDDLLTQPGGLDHGFHDTRQGPRYTVGPLVRQEILDRLLEENQRRYAAEVAAGLHDKKGAKKKAAAPAKRKSKPPAEEPPSLF